MENVRRQHALDERERKTKFDEDIAKAANASEDGQTSVKAPEEEENETIELLAVPEMPDKAAVEILRIYPRRKLQWKIDRDKAEKAEKAEKAKLAGGKAESGKPFPFSGFLLLGCFRTRGESACPRISYLPVLLPGAGMLSAGSKKRRAEGSAFWFSSSWRFWDCGVRACGRAFPTYLFFCRALAC